MGRGHPSLHQQELEGTPLLIPHPASNLSPSTLDLAPLSPNPGSAPDISRHSFKNFI